MVGVAEAAAGSVDLGGPEAAGDWSPAELTGDSRRVNVADVEDFPLAGTDLCGWLGISHVVLLRQGVRIRSRCELVQC